jgi:hypothetical protein
MNTQFTKKLGRMKNSKKRLKKWKKALTFTKFIRKIK